MIPNITITCFAASYGVALALEISRLFFRVSVRFVVLALFTIAGLFAHTSFLIMRAWEAMETTGGVVLSSWFDWCLVAAWVMAAVYCGSILRQPQNAIGLFLLPLVLLLVGVAYGFQGMEPFPRSTALTVWRAIHGITLLGGTVVVLLGFAAGIMYLIQSARLKHRLPPRQGFRLPSLESLQSLNKRSLLWSTALLGCGLLSGMVMNLVKQSNQNQTLSWTDPVVVSSGVLFLWLMTALIFEWVYRPARQGRKVAYLTLANFVFLGLVLGFVLFSSHGSSEGTSQLYLAPRTDQRGDLQYAANGRATRQVTATLLAREVRA